MRANSPSWAVTCHEILRPCGISPYLSQNIQPPYGVLFPHGHCLSMSHHLQTPAFLPPMPPPCPILCVPLDPFPSLGHLWDILQGCPDLYLQSLLTPPCIPFSPSHFVALLPCADLKYRPQIHLLFHCRRCKPHPIQPPPRLLPCDFSQEPGVSLPIFSPLQSTGPKTPIWIIAPPVPLPYRKFLLCWCPTFNFLVPSPCLSALGTSPSPSCIQTSFCDSPVVLLECSYHNGRSVRVA